MDRKNLYQEVEDNTIANQSNPLKSSHLLGKAHSVTQQSNKHEFFHLLRSHQISNNNI